MRDLARSSSPSSRAPVDLMKTVDTRGTDPYGYDSQDDASDDWRCRNRGSSDYEDDTDYDDDTDTQTLFDDPLPMTYYNTKLERQSPRVSEPSKPSSRRQRTKSMPMLLPASWKAVLNKVGKRTKSSS